jgi:hypothetical protein
VNKSKFEDRNKSTRAEQEYLYDHFLYYTQVEEPERVIRRFRYLFIKATGYEDNQARLALEKIVMAENANSEFPLFLNRCCHIIINRWQLNPDLKLEIPLLIAELEQALPPGSATARSSQKLRQLIKDFQTTEQYTKLQRLARLIDLSPEGRARVERVEIVETSVGDLIERYPYLYQHCLVSEDSTEEFLQNVQKIQTQLQRDYEVNLTQYITYRVRMVQTVRKYKAANVTKIPKKLFKPIDNPTLLSDRELDRALSHYMGKIEKNCSYHDLSQSFLHHTAKVSSYKAFKDDLYEYMISGIDPNYGKRRFNDKLQRYLQDTLPDFHDRQVNEFLILRTCSQLFKFLVVDSKSNPNHSQYLDLITYLGETKAVGLLLKLVLVCGKLKPYLENRFSILFAHYEAVSESGVPWLIKSLENLQVAFSIHFGKADVSLLKMI